ncbi:unnamed protein product [Dibothriocephalus latus]|uniref:Uncharacterized protein n=1 Tax=Dibothriocephalus latus TaxID=60516 RepID=A0A3P7LEL1_DIBLA|nr:unnamed protein product [Dibothriocephalus latus]
MIIRPQSINKRKDLAFPYCELRHCLSKRIGYVGRAGPNNNSDDSEHNCHAITKPVSDMDKEIAAINESKAKCQAITAPSKTQVVATGVDNYIIHADDRYEL